MRELVEQAQPRRITRRAEQRRRAHERLVGQPGRFPAGVLVVVSLRSGHAPSFHHFIDYASVARRARCNVIQRMTIRPHHENAVQHWVVPVGYALVVAVMMLMFLALLSRV